jgi:hypothetical protein
MNKLLFIKIRKLSISCKNTDRRCLLAVEPNGKTILAPREEKIRTNLLYNIKLTLCRILILYVIL